MSQFRGFAKPAATQNRRVIAGFPSSLHSFVGSSIDPRLARPRTPGKIGISCLAKAVGEDQVGFDLIVIGGGVVGLSVALEAATRGARVGVVDRVGPERQASWAGAGIIPAPPGPRASQPLDALFRRASELHQQWSLRLREQTGIDNGYRCCGGLLIADSAGEAASLSANQALWTDEGFEFEAFSKESAAARFVELTSAPAWTKVKRVIWTPGEAQLRNPWHLQALKAACVKMKVELHAGEVVGLQKNNGVWCAETASERFESRDVCIASGAWSRLVAQLTGFSLEIVPIRGQMLLYRFPQPPFSQIVNVGPRYFVPRADGHVLVGSTEEEAGFDASTTDEGLGLLETFARQWLPIAEDQKPLMSWAGLRPASIDGHPVIGEIGHQSRLFVAAGHFRNGLTLSPATAERVVNAMEGKTSPDAVAFRPERGWAPTAR